MFPFFGESHEENKPQGGRSCRQRNGSRPLKGLSIPPELQARATALMGSESANSSGNDKQTAKSAM